MVVLQWKLLHDPTAVAYSVHRYFLLAIWMRHVQICLLLRVVEHQTLICGIHLQVRLHIALGFVVHHVGVVPYLLVLSSAHEVLVENVVLLDVLLTEAALTGLVGVRLKLDISVQHGV